MRAGLEDSKRRACLRLVVVIVAFLWGMLVVRAADAPAPTRVRVATFNVLNYLEMDRRIDGGFRPAYPKPEVEKAAIREVIRCASPDVLALEEMGPVPYLEELRQDLVREGLVFDHSYLLEAADAERHVAVLSRLPFAAVTPHAEVEFTYFGEKELVKRGMIEARFGDGDEAWTLFVVHLKSRYTDRPDDPMSETRRTLEARALRDLVLKRFPDPSTARFLVAGDFNDTRGSRTLAAFLHRGEKPITELVPTVDSRGESWTHRFLPEESYTRVDFILPSPGWRSAVVEGRGTIHDGPGALAGSDHRLVFLDLNLQP